VIPEDEFFLVYGDGTLKHALTEINREAKAASLDKVIRYLEGEV